MRMIDATRAARRFAGVLALAAVFAGAGPAGAAEIVLHVLDAESEGSGPRAGLAIDPSGALYGTTVNGGPGGHGTVFRLSPPVAPSKTWTHTLLHAFAGGADGANPEGGLVTDGAGIAYGITTNGGARGYGSVFSLTPPVPPSTVWTKTTLYSFAGAPDGAYPHATLVFDGTTGALYGTTEGGGAPGAGVVFRLSPDRVDGCGDAVWTETVIYSFKGSEDGATPYAGVVFDTAGALYGTTHYGGKGYGTVFRLVPQGSPAKPWRKTTLHRFAGGTAGANPYAGLIVDSRGALYGTTRSGGPKDTGTVFRIAPPVPPAKVWKKSVLTAFRSPPDGASPYARLVLDSATGSLYGTTQWGGASGNGIVYRLDRPTPPATRWKRTTLHAFRNTPDGSGPYGEVLFGPSGQIYGTTYAGGKGAGTVFQIR